jgi:hypothetical protein
VNEKDSIYKSVVKITHQYLGPAADRFIDRQVRNHLQKDPVTLTQKDLSKLIDWIRVAVSLLTDDMVVIKEYIEQLKKLASVSRKK